MSYKPSIETFAITHGLYMEQHAKKQYATIKKRKPQNMILDYFYTMNYHTSQHQLTQKLNANVAVQVWSKYKVL